MCKREGRGRGDEVHGAREVKGKRQNGEGERYRLLGRLKETIKVGVLMARQSENQITKKYKDASILSQSR